MGPAYHFRGSHVLGITLDQVIQSDMLIPDRWRSPFQPVKGLRDLTIPKKGTIAELQKDTS